MSYDSISGKRVIAGRHAKKSSSTKTYQVKKTPSELNDEAINALHSNWAHPLSRHICKIPKKGMVPSRRIYELIGFNFSPSKNSAYYVATMPAGWRVVNSGINCKLYIVDAKGFRRGEKIWDFHNPNFTLLTRYSTTFLRLDPDTIEVIVKDSDGRVIYSAGCCSEFGSDKYKQLEEKCYAFLQKNFPDWREYDAYWD